MKERMRLMIAYDGSVYADSAIDDLRRAGLAREGKALVVSVGKPTTPVPVSIYEAASVDLASRRVASTMTLTKAESAQPLSETEKLAANASERVQSFLPEWDVEYEAVGGTPAYELLHKVKEWKANMIVVGNQERSRLSRLFVNSVSKKVAVESPCSVRVVRRAHKTGADRPVRILLGVDGSPGAQMAIGAVGRRAWPEGTEIRLLTVDDGTWPTRIADHQAQKAQNPNGAQPKEPVRALMLSEWAAQEFHNAGLHVSVEIKAGQPLGTLIKEAREWEADSIFVGAHGLASQEPESGLGKVAAGLVTDAPCSVEVIR